MLAIIAFLFVLGLTGGDDDERRRRDSSDRQATRRPRRSATRERDQPAAAEQEQQQRARNVRLEVVPARNVWVCVVDAKGRSGWEA